MAAPRRSARARLDAVAAGLTVRQRIAALLALEADDLTGIGIIGQGLTPARRAAFHRTWQHVIRWRLTVHACGVAAGYRIAYLELLGQCRAVLRLDAAEADRMEAAFDEWNNRRGPVAPALAALVRGHAEVLRTLPATVESGGGDPALAIGAQLRDGIGTVHHLLRAVEIEGAAFAAELGADPLTSELQALIARQRTALTACIEEIALDPPVTLTEPSAEFVAALAAPCRSEEEDVSW